MLPTILFVRIHIRDTAICIGVYARMDKNMILNNYNIYTVYAHWQKYLYLGVYICVCVCVCVIR